MKVRVELESQAEPAANNVMEFQDVNSLSDALLLWEGSISYVEPQDKVTIVVQDASVFGNGKTRYETLLDTAIAALEKIAGLGALGGLEAIKIARETQEKLNNI